MRALTAHVPSCIKWNLSVALGQLWADDLSNTTNDQSKIFNKKHKNINKCIKQTVVENTQKHTQKGSTCDIQPGEGSDLIFDPQSTYNILSICHQQTQSYHAQAAACTWGNIQNKFPRCNASFHRCNSAHLNSF